VAFRKHTLFPLDDCLYALQAIIPIGYFHLDLAEGRTAEGKLYLFVGIDRTSKFAFVELVERADMRAAAAFLQALIEAIPYRIHTVLTDHGIQFADLPKNRRGPTARFRGHPFDRVCFLHGIDHRLTKPNHPWTNGQLERMNRTIQEATVQRYHYDSHHQLRTHLGDLLTAYNFAKRLKTLAGLTAYEFICKCWLNEPHRLTLDPIHQMPALTLEIVPSWPAPKYLCGGQSTNSPGPHRPGSLRQDRNASHSGGRL
jgi:transposase-like protein